MFTTSPTKKKGKEEIMYILKKIVEVGILGVVLVFFFKELVRRCNRTPVFLYILSNKHHDQKQQ